MSEELLTSTGKEGGPPKPRRVAGWADDGREKGRRKRDTVEDDERLRVPEGPQDDEEDLPVIPDLEAVQEEDLTTQIAAPPTLAVNKTATYRQLESKLHQHTFALNGNIDLQLLSKSLSPETDVKEEDVAWGWDKLIAEMSTDIQAVWEQRKGTLLPQHTDKTEQPAINIT